MPCPGLTQVGDNSDRWPTTSRRAWWGWVVIPIASSTFINLRPELTLRMALPGGPCYLLSSSALRSRQDC
eukprot:1928793-Rhodomonas_salina.4